MDLQAGLRYSRANYNLREINYMILSINRTIRLIENISSEKLTKGDLGVIVEIFSDPEIAYEVEFCDEKGRTIAQVVLKEHQFEVLE